MFRQTHSLLLSVVLSTSATACTSESPAPCVVANAPYFARYTVVSQQGPCDAAKGEPVGIEAYPAATPGTNAPDRTHLRLALQSETMGNLQYELPGESDLVRPYAFGDFTAFADGDSICRANDLQPAEIDLPDRPTGEVDDMGNPIFLPAVHRRETWNNVSMYVTNDFPGMTFAADITIDDVIRGCSTTYTVSALSPASSCGNEIYDDFGEVVGYGPNDALCDPAPNDASGGVFGSGVDPRIATRCDPETLYCVLVGSPLNPF